MTRRTSTAVVMSMASLLGLLSACGSDDDAPDAAAAEAVATTTATSTPTSSSTTSTTVIPTTLPSEPPTTVAAAPPATQAAPRAPRSSPTPPPATEPPPPPPPAGPVGPPYEWSIAVIDDAIRARMPHSWRPGCPVPLEELRLVTVRHWNDAGATTTGELVVHADSADAMVRVFGDLYAAGFPIARMELVDVYGGDDGASMRANNTSAFNCRAVAGTNTWSQHSYGRAVDVNPLVNPWVRGGTVDPPEGRAYADRSNQVPGGIYAGDAVVQAFRSVGWAWGGAWSGTKDYQHFSANGR